MMMQASAASPAGLRSSSGMSTKPEVCVARAGVQDDARHGDVGAHDVGEHQPGELAAIAAGRRSAACGACSAAQPERAAERDQRAQDHVPGGERPVEQQPHREQQRPEQRKGSQRFIGGESTRVDVGARGVQRLRGVAAGSASPGPACTVSAAHSASSSTTGAISITRTRGTLRSCDAQKMRMPVRPSR